MSQLLNLGERDTYSDILCRMSEGSGADVDTPWREPSACSGPMLSHPALPCPVTTLTPKPPPSPVVGRIVSIALGWLVDAPS